MAEVQQRKSMWLWIVVVAFGAYWVRGQIDDLKPKSEPLKPATSMPGYFTMNCGEGNGPIVGHLNKVAFMVPPKNCWTEWVTFSGEARQGTCESSGALIEKWPDEKEYSDIPGKKDPRPPLPRQIRFKNVDKDWVSYSCNLY